MEEYKRNSPSLPRIVAEEHKKGMLMCKKEKLFIQDDIIIENLSEIAETQ